MLALFVAAQVTLVPPVPAAAVGVLEPPSWWQVAARDATMRLVDAEPPAAPRRYRFQCVGERLSRKPARDGSRYTPQRCIDADEGIATDAATFGTRGAAEATRPVASSDQRRYRAAWLRAMTLHPAPLDRGEAMRSYLVEEVIAPGDRLAPPPVPDPTASADLVFEVRPAVDYPPALLRADVEGTVPLACSVVAQRAVCRTVTVGPATALVRPDGSLEPDIVGRMLLLHAAHWAMQAARFATTTRSGRPSEGTAFTIPISFRLTRD